MALSEPILNVGNQIAHNYINLYAFIVHGKASLGNTLGPRSTVGNLFTNILDFEIAVYRVKTERPNEENVVTSSLILDAVNDWKLRYIKDDEFAERIDKFLEDNPRERGK